MRISFYNFSRWYLGAVCCIFGFLGSQLAHGAFLVPTSLSGSISYGYGYSKTIGGAASESQSITANINGSGFVWQPWFIQGGASLSDGFIRSDSTASRDSATNQAYGGSLTLNVFPISRFPFSLTVNHNNTRLDSSQSFGGISAYETTSTQVFARQSYYPQSGYDTNASWAYSRVESFSSTSTSNVFNADTRKAYVRSSWVTTANYSTVEDSTSDRKPENWNINFNHNYTPGNQSSIASLLSTSGTRLTGGGINSNSRSAQASSIFSWRPEYRPYSFSGGARISTNDTKQHSDDAGDMSSRSDSASLSLGVNYRLSRKMNLLISGSGTGSMDETDNSEITTTTASANASTSYASDVYNLIGFQYGWNAGGGAGVNYTNSEVNDETESQAVTESTATGGLSLGHRLSRGWAVGRATGLNLSLSQSISGSGSDDGSLSWGTGVGSSFSGSSRGISGTSFAGVSGSYSYNENIPEEGENVEVESMFVNGDLSRNQTINRLSALTANLSAQWRRQKSIESDTTSQNANANLNYRHQRFLGIYAMDYDSIASYSIIFNPGEDQTESMYWRNTWRYNVGLLDLSLFIDFAREGSSPTRGSLRFRATRSF